MVLWESKEICLKSSKKGTSNVEFTRGFSELSHVTMPGFAWFALRKSELSQCFYFCEATQPRAPGADGALKSSFVSSAVRSRQPRDVGWQVLCVVAYSPTLNQRWACCLRGQGKSVCRSMWNIIIQHVTTSSLPSVWLTCEKTRLLCPRSGFTAKQLMHTQRI